LLEYVDSVLALDPWTVKRNFEQGIKSLIPDLSKVVRDDGNIDLIICAEAGHM
jgi:hypothetical protein